jgi:glycosyltransferase involved in cell wall biosynthesis
VLFLQSQRFFGADSEMHANIMRNLDRATWTVHVALGDTTPSDAPQSAYRNIHLIDDVVIRPTNFGPQRADVTSRYSPRVWLRFVRLAVDIVGLGWYIRRNRIDVIHGTEKPRDAVFAVLLGKLTRARSVVHLHVGWNTWISRTVQWALRNADAVVGVSQFVRESAVRDGGVRPERCHVILNGIDASRFDPDTDPSPVRAEFDIGDDEVVLGIFSRMSVWKGHLDLARALGVVDGSNPHFRVLVVGTDDVRSAPDRPPVSFELAALTKELGIDDRFVLTGWRTDIELLMAACDIYAMPTFEEPLGVVFLEAMAMMKPVVALQSGGVPEVVTDEEVGLLAPVGDIDGLAERILRLMNDAQLRRRMGAAGRKHVTEVRTSAQMAADADQIYRLLVETSGS